MRRAELFFLLIIRVGSSKRFFHQLLLVSDNNSDLFYGGVRQVKQNMFRKRFSADAVKHLRKIGLHSFPKPRCENQRRRMINHKELRFFAEKQKVCNSVVMAHRNHILSKPTNFLCFCEDFYNQYYTQFKRKNIERIRE